MKIELTKEDVFKNTTESELFCIFTAFMDRWKEKFNDKSKEEIEAMYEQLPTDKQTIAIVAQIMRDYDNKTTEED